MPTECFNFNGSHLIYSGRVHTESVGLDCSKKWLSFRVKFNIFKLKKAHFRIPLSAVNTSLTWGLLGNMVTMFFVAAAISAGCWATWHPSAWRNNKKSSENTTNLELINNFRVHIVDDQFVAGPQQIASHMSSHITKPDKPNQRHLKISN